MSRDSSTTSPNVSLRPARVTRAQREALHGHRSAVLWFTGLSGAGKSTLAHAVEHRLYQLGASVTVLNGDNIRQSLCEDLGFSERDRAECNRRTAEVARLLLDAGIIVLTAVISPLKVYRARARALVPEGDFVEIYCDAPLEICEQRDPKGLYRRARAGEIPEFTGISSPYEPPEHPEIVVHTGTQPVDACTDQILAYLQKGDRPLF